MIADLHALTISQDPHAFKRMTREKIIELLAVGLNPEKCTLFIQSQVKEHAELTWILNTITPISELERSREQTLM